MSQVANSHSVGTRQRPVVQPFTNELSCDNLSVNAVVDEIFFRYVAQMHMYCIADSAHPLHAQPKNGKEQEKNAKEAKLNQVIVAYYCQVALVTSLGGCQAVHPLCFLYRIDASDAELSAVGLSS